MDGIRQNSARWKGENMSLITLQIDGNEFDFSLLTEEEITKCIYLYESKKHSDLHKFNSIILSKYVGDHFQSLKEQVDDTPAVLGQIYSRLMALSGTTFPIEIEEFNEDDLKKLEQLKISKRKAKKLVLIPIEERTKEECSVLYRRMNQLEYEATRLDTMNEPHRVYEIFAKIGKDFSLEKEKSDRLSAMYASYYINAGIQLQSTVIANVSVAAKKP